MKDRILKIMKQEGMTQQQFSQATGLAPASLSSIFTGRTLPTLKHAEALHRRFPNLSMSWLLFGDGEMFVEQRADEDVPSTDSVVSSGAGDQSSPASLFPLQAAIPMPGEQNTLRGTISPTSFPTSQPAAMPMSHNSEQLQAATPTQPLSYDYLKNYNIKQRKIAEIRIFFDDGTFEVFPGNA